MQSKRITFGIKTLFAVTLVVAVIMALVAYQAYWMTGLVATVLLMNLIGAVVAFVLTRGFGFPTDGGFRDPELREMHTPESKNDELEV